MKKLAIVFLVFSLFYSLKTAHAQCTMPEKITVPANCTNRIAGNTSTISIPGNWCLGTQTVSVNSLSVAGNGAVNIYVNSGESLTANIFNFQSGSPVNIYVLSAGTFSITGNVTLPANVIIFNYGVVTMGGNVALSGSIFNYFNGRMDLKTTLSLSGSSARLVNKGEIAMATLNNFSAASGNICLSSASCTKVGSYSGSNIYPVVLADSTKDFAYFSLTGAANFESPFTGSKGIRVCISPNAPSNFVNWGNAVVVRDCIVQCLTALVDTNKSKTVTACGALPTIRIPLAAATGGTGNYAYQWQSVNDTINGKWTNVSKATGQVLEKDTVISKTTYFRRLVSDGNQTLISKVQHFKIILALKPGHIKTPEPASICRNSTLTLRVDTLPSDPNGGKITYEWQQNGDGWMDTDIYGPEYVEEGIYFSNSYHLKVNSSSCYNESYSSEVFIKVKSLIESAGDNTIREDQVLCTKGTPGTISGSLIDQNGFKYTWFSAPSANGPWSEEPSSSGTIDFSPGLLTSTTYFRRRISSDDFCGVSESNIVTIVIGDNNPLHVFDPNDDDNPTCGMLRYAIDWANEMNGYDTIVFKDNLYGREITAVSPFQVREGVSIVGSAGNPVSISGDNLGEGGYSLFNFIQSGSDTSISRLSGVNLYNTYLDRRGALILVGPRDYSTNSSGSFYLKDCNIYNNSLSFGSTVMYFTGKNLTVENCRFYNNEVSLYSSVVSGAVIAVGSLNGKMLVSKSIFNNNGIADFYPDDYYPHGGAISLMNPGKYECRIEGSTFARNTSYNSSAVDYSGNGESDSLIIVNSTFSDNINYGDGGAIKASGKVSLYNTTIADNEAPNGTFYSDGQEFTLGGHGGGVFLKDNGVANLKNTIVAHNKSSYAGADIFVASQGTDRFNSQGNNLIGIADLAGFTPKTTDITGTAAKPVNLCSPPCLCREQKMFWPVFRFL